MADLSERFCSFIDKYSYLLPGDRVLVAVSGGLDSMVLLDLLAGCCSRFGIELAAANFDHGLRTEAEATREKKHVEEYCRSHSIHFYFDSGKTAEFARENSLNVHDAARKLRYSFFDRVMKDEGWNKLATAHHADDQAETVLIRLLSGSGLAGLAAMERFSREAGLIRPLLDFGRDELEKYAAEKNIRWCEDPSNAQDKYLRNRLRHKMIPEIERKYGINFRVELVALADAASRYRTELKLAVEKVRERIVETVPQGMRIDTLKLSDVPGIVRRQLLRETAESMVTDIWITVSGRALAALESLAMNGESGKSVDLPGGLTAIREFDSLLLAFRDEKQSPAIDNYTELPAEGSVSINLNGRAWRLTCEKVLRNCVDDRELKENHDVQHFDLDCLALPLSCRDWQPGDRIQPFGMDTGRRKLKEIFREQAIGVSRRHAIPVICDRNGEIIWVAGLVRGNRCPVKESTIRVLRLTGALK